MFLLRQQLVNDFSEYIHSFLNIKQSRISEYVENELGQGALWPEPLVQLNPSFEPGQLIDELVEIGRLDARCSGIFRRSKSEAAPNGQPLRLFRHQEQAIDRAQQGKNYVLTTGTGSGKSLSYILPIVDAILKEGSGKGIRALVVYPMNALANSQVGELTKYLGAKPLVTFARYTGQESQEERDQITASPPDILLTNYMMLELILSRPLEKQLVESMGGLRFVVLDELHTYRGRQGADVALLVRRLRERSGVPKIQFIGTSATMATEGKAAERRQAVSEVATRLFGVTVQPEDVIGETLQRLSPARQIQEATFLQELGESLGTEAPTRRGAFLSHPLTSWLESTIGLRTDDETRLVRAHPAPLHGAQGAAHLLASDLGIAEEEAALRIESHLLAAGNIEPDPRTGARPFLFRLHQFLSPGTGVFSTLNEGDDRYLSLDGQKSDPNNPEHLLFSLAFCRSCGQHYYLVFRQQDESGVERVIPRALSENPVDELTTKGFLYIPEDGTFPNPEDLIPEDWYEEHRGKRRLRKSREAYQPQSVSVGRDGRFGGSVQAWFLRAPFCLCVNSDCGVAYTPRDSDISKLSVLGLQGRSTATTTLSLSTLAFLRESKEVEESARKLLAFTDNRQDASLQAGHLNDFVEVGLLRAAIYAAARDAGSGGIAQDAIALAVEKQLALQPEDYSEQAGALPRQVEQRRKALRDVLGYRIFRDLRRGWRINAPNLEQVGLLKIEYPDLRFVCEDESYWQGSHELLLGASAATREYICLELLERMRKKLTIHVDYLKSDYQEQIQRNSSTLLKLPWALSDDEAAKMETATFAWLHSGKLKDELNDLFLTPRSALGVFLRRQSTFGVAGLKLNLESTQTLLEDLVRVLLSVALIREVEPATGLTAYQLNADAFVWRASEPAENEKRTQNRFFERFYRERATQLKGIYAREHTAQVPARQREEREQDFRAGKLPVMFCSPTMELGVDIADLNVVNLRNVPPTPANYAQRSGRAGRSGQPALVYTYCTSGSPHDQYYFRRQEQMVAGAVAPPRLDVANEDLVRSHVHAIWLGEADLFLETSLADRVLDVQGDTPTLLLREELTERLQSTQVRDKARQRARRMLDDIQAELSTTSWYTDRWLDDIIGQIPLSFDRACDRWRNLYRAALEQARAQDKIIRDATTQHGAREQAQRLRREAEQQMALLRDASSATLSDFYVYRYLASEGFLPGYNFPRLPLSAYLPAQRGKSDDFLSRPRFLAVSEFGPGAVVYHEGSRYLVDRVLTSASGRSEDGKLNTLSVKLCTTCGYVHSGDIVTTVNVCERCGSPLEQEAEIVNLFRMEAVNLRRRDRITCDEEERMRQGYELRTGVQFKGLPGALQSFRAEVKGADGGMLATMTYAQAATIWRINVGWNRRKNKQALGYQLDTDTGRWLSDTGANTLMEADTDTHAQRAQRVVPFVEDRRNALIFEPKAALSIAQFASLQAALKAAIQAVFQLEDSELATEPLPSSDVRNAVLLYESAEGGAGVLRRLVDEPRALQTVVRKALELCHYDPETLEDKRRSERAREDCSTACYDCLMSYGNQRDHLLVDRRALLEVLVALKDATVEAGSGLKSRSAQLALLLEKAGSNLEREWLKLLEAKNLNLPTYGQYRIPDAHTVPDFVYVHGATKLVVYIDGPPHDYPQRQLRDAEQDFTLMAQGWLVQRFHHKADWEKLLKEFPSVYGAV
ncbi:DEAD/DEAH box helicase [Armatimonas sp.]|uniref:DEAD/DEAH box helicase n=1 Tax=Armatimonas sp. TaxID=1872638 RepID=UPI003753D0FA